jgi:hypothetical protein
MDFAIHLAPTVAENLFLGIKQVILPRRHLRAWACMHALTFKRHGNTVNVA